MSALGRQTQADLCDFQASLVNIERCCLKAIKTQGIMKEERKEGKDEGRETGREGGRKDIKEMFVE